MRRTAKSGVLANLRLLAVGPSGPHEVGAAGCGLTEQIFAAAAEAGQLQMCKQLRELGCAWQDDVLDAAARGGHTDVVLWLRQAGCPSGYALSPAAAAGDCKLCQRLVAEGFPWLQFAAGSAAYGGHAELVRWFLAQREQDPQRRHVDCESLLAGVAYGQDLATLQVWCLAASTVLALLQFKSQTL
jgi:hypothetical protein